MANMTRTLALLALAALALTACEDDPLPYFPYVSDAADDDVSSGDVDPGDGDSGDTVDRDGSDRDVGDDADDAAEDPERDTIAHDVSDPDAPCVDQCSAGRTGCDDDATSWVCQRDPATGCLERRAVACGRGTYCDDGACVCPGGFCSLRSAGEFCDDDHAVLCELRNGCPVEAERELCDVGCDAGECDCPSNPCSDAGVGSGSICDGDDRVRCGVAGECRVEQSRTSCPSGCAAGVCLSDTCGELDEECCDGGACDTGLACSHGEVCVAAPTPLQVRRYVSACPESPACDDSCFFYANDSFCDDGGPGSSSSACGFGTDCTDCGPRGDDFASHWHSDAECYPGPTESTACFCGDTAVNPGCGVETCWQQEVAFETYATDPGVAGYEQLFHCFTGTANFYQVGTPCERDGYPATLGWVALSPDAAFSTPIHRCRLGGETLLDEFLTADAEECAALGYERTTTPSSPAFYALAD